MRLYRALLCPCGQTACRGPCDSEASALLWLLVPDETLDGHPFYACWTQPAAAGASALIVQHHGTFSGTATESLESDRQHLVGHVPEHSVRLVFALDASGPDAAVAVHPDEAGCGAVRSGALQLVNAGARLRTHTDGHEASVYAGVLAVDPAGPGAERSRRVLVLALPWDCAADEPIPIMLLDMGVDTPADAAVELDEVAVDRWERPALGQGLFTAQSARWRVRGVCGGNDDAGESAGEKDGEGGEGGEGDGGAALRVSVQSVQSVALNDGDSDSDSDNLARLTLVSGHHLFFVPIVVTLINDSGQTCQYWTARGDPHVAEDMVNLGLNALSFIAPDYSPSKVIGMVTKGRRILSKIQDAVKAVQKSAVGGTVLQGVDFLQRKTGKMNEVDLLEHGQRRTFWDLDGTVTGTLNMGITWFSFVRDRVIDGARVTDTLFLHTAKRSFAKFQNTDVRTSALFDRGAFSAGEMLRPRGTMKNPLPAPWERTEQRLKLATSERECDFHGEHVADLRLVAGVAPADPEASPFWMHDVLCDPVRGTCYKNAFDWRRHKVPSGTVVGQLDSTSQLMLVRGDPDQYQPADKRDCPTVGVAVRDYVRLPLGARDEPAKRAATAFAGNIAVLECAYIQEGDWERCPVERIDLGAKISNPMKPPNPSKPYAPYDPMLKCIRDGLGQNEHWKKRFWAFWWDPSTLQVHGAVYREREPGLDVAPWLIKRKSPIPSQGPYDCALNPVVVFFCGRHMPLRFPSFSEDDDQ